MAIANLLVPAPNIPQPNFSWLNSIADSVGGAINTVKQDKSFNGLADRLQGGAAPAPQQPSGGFLSGLMGGQQQRPQATGMTAPVMPVQRGGGPVDPAIRDGIVKTASALGISPVDLATAISYETAGTYDPKKGGPTTQWGQHRGLIQFGEPQAQKYGVNWEDPVGSQLGENGAVANYLRDTGVKPGMGLMDIYSAINAGGVGRYDRSDANNGGAPGTVADKVNKQMAGHRARAEALFGNAASPEGGAAGAVNAMAQGGLDPSSYVDPSVSAPNASSALQPQQREQAAMQVAGDANPLIAAGATPVQRGGVDPSVIQYMLRDRNLRETGLKLWAANAQGQKSSEPWQFVNLPDGTLARANQQTGAVERLGNFAKPNQDAVAVGDNLVNRTTGEVIYEGKGKAPTIVELFDEQTGQPYKAKFNPDTQSYDRVGGIKAPSNGMSVTTNPDGTTTVSMGGAKPPKLTEAEARNSGFLVRADQSQKILNGLEGEGTSLWNSTAGKIPIAGNFLRSQDAQKYDQAKRDFVNALLRRESGAVISPDEFGNAEQQYFPQPGDGPEVIAQKRANREAAIKGLDVGSGAGSKLVRPDQPQRQKTSTGVQWSIEE